MNARNPYTTPTRPSRAPSRTTRQRALPGVLDAGNRTNARRELSSSALHVIEIHEAAGGSVDVVRVGDRMRWFVDGGEAMTPLDASILLAERRARRSVAAA